MLAVFSFGGSVDPLAADRVQSLCVMAFTLVFIALSHRRFWGMTWTRTLVLTVGLAVLSWVIIYPGLAIAAKRLNVTGFITQLTK